MSEFDLPSSKTAATVINWTKPESPDTVIKGIATTTVNGVTVQLVGLHNDLCIAISGDSMACYRNPSCLGDPLGNGLLASTQFAPGVTIQLEEKGCVDHFRAGFIRLVDGQMLLLTPFHVRLFANVEAGLSGHSWLAELTLSDIELK